MTFAKYRGTNINVQQYNTLGAKDKELNKSQFVFVLDICMYLKFKCIIDFSAPTGAQEVKMSVRACVI